MTRHDETLIRDADLREQLEKSRSTPFAFETVVSFLITSQQKRDDAQAAENEKTAKLSAMPRVQRKRANIRYVIENGEAANRDNLSHIHSVLAICGLPYTKQPIETREYERRHGRMSLVVEAGKLMTSSGVWERQPLPYGSRARLLMMHLCSESMRQKSRTIEIADSLSAFIRDMGFEVSGGKTGSLTYFKQQVNALAACRLQIGVWGNGGASTIETKPFSKMEVWLPENPDQQMLWPSTITFSSEFYDSLTQRALPINNHVARAFAGSARKLDLLFWLSYRLKNLDKPLVLTWDALQGQFGEGFSRQRAFRAQFAEEVADLKSVLPKVPLVLSERGLTLSPASSTVLAIPAPRASKKG